MTTLYRQEISFIPQVDIKINRNKLVSCNIKRDGVLVTSNKYGKVYFVIKNELFVTTIKDIEEKFDNADETHLINTINSHSFTLEDDITQITLSCSELVLAVCSGSSILLCDTRQLFSNVK